MIDAMVSLAFSVYSNRGVYALLLGSGISRAAGIPTGWEIVVDLIRQLDLLYGEACEPNEEAWFQTKFGLEPNYSDLLNRLAPTAAARRELLNQYFVPTDDERASGAKQPTRAHRAIAELAARGFIRAILTTNFDTLTEDALRDAGVEVYVVRHHTDIQGMKPISHGGCTVIKLHGDFLDSRIRNTPTELQAYTAAQNKLLDRIVDEFGLVICGWSATYDRALRDAIARCGKSAAI